MVIGSNKVFTRKEHHCWGCGIKFPPKTNMIITTWVDGGDISNSYWCEVCHAFLDENNENFEEGVSFGEFAGELVYQEYKRNYL